MKEKKFVKNNHRPLHIYDWRFYFVSARTFEAKKYFKNDYYKKYFIKKFSKISKKLNIKIYSFVLLENHYHAIIEVPIENKSNDKFVLSEFFRRLHSQTGSFLNSQEKVLGRKVWYQYWDYCIRNKKDFWIHFNYILQNPLKHKLVKNLECCFDYRYSTNTTWKKRLGKEGLSESLNRYPIRSFVPDGLE